MVALTSRKKEQVAISIGDARAELERIRRKRVCAYCERDIVGEVHYGIHRDGFGEGPEVDLCDGCGANPAPTCEAIWAKISRSGT